MDGTGDEFLAGPVLPANQHRRASLGDRLHQMQSMLEREAFANDLLEVVLRSNLFFQVEFLLRQLVLQIGDLSVSERILNCQRDLVGDLTQEGGIVLGKSILSSAAEAQNAKDAFPANERQVNH